VSGWRLGGLETSDGSVSALGLGLLRAGVWLTLGSLVILAYPASALARSSAHSGAPAGPPMIGALRCWSGCPWSSWLWRLPTRLSESHACCSRWQRSWRPSWPAWSGSRGHGSRPFGLSAAAPARELTRTGVALSVLCCLRSCLSSVQPCGLAGETSVGDRRGGRRALWSATPWRCRFRALRPG